MAGSLRLPEITMVFITGYIPNTNKNFKKKKKSKERYPNPEMQTISSAIQTNMWGT